jgi:hypothetical protein
MVTFYVAKWQNVLANDKTFSAFKSAIARLTNWNVIAAVLMPEHAPFIAPYDRDAVVGNASGAIKRSCAEHWAPSDNGSRAALTVCSARVN